MGGLSATVTADVTAEMILSKRLGGACRQNEAEREEWCACWVLFVVELDEERARASCEGKL